MQTEKISWEDFAKVEICAGTIIKAENFLKARKPAYKLLIDFGEKGVLKSSAQIADFYTPEDLAGKQIIAVINFPPKQIANFISECLVLGVVNKDNKVILISPDKNVINGLKIA
jgi:tRNA-binding protein